jgi:hypothetical protein
MFRTAASYVGGETKKEPKWSLMNLFSMDQDERRIAQWVGFAAGGLFAALFVLNAITY